MQDRIIQIQTWRICKIRVGFENSEGIIFRRTKNTSLRMNNLYQPMSWVVVVVSYSACFFQPRPCSVVLYANFFLIRITSSFIGRSNHHPGNRPYWRLILENRTRYKNCRGGMSYFGVVEHRAQTQLLWNLLTFFSSTFPPLFFLRIDR